MIQDRNFHGHKGIQDTINDKCVNKQNFSSLKNCIYKKTGCFRKNNNTLNSEMKSMTKVAQNMGGGNKNVLFWIPTIGVNLHNINECRM